ncbi:MAG: dephospho-CoA kinase [Polaromonas sp.]|uniref:dephospho-CoA kinase n=1 Tax=Polaromonas sp. TaxID=1869339 RepID=UPI0017F4D3D8|nr:dephospho-CoA kinase [Polaromonas sp.]NMM10667.1 dephospho-CoA kinase [Polaromonas sp.]
MGRAIRRLGLTGGIGSGKSTVARMLVATGATLVDADVISRQITAPGGAAVSAIASQFGDHVIMADGVIDRDKLRQLVFNDPAAKRQLEAIVHPLVSLEIARQSQQAVKTGSNCIVFDIPLLVESRRWRQQVDRVLVVDCCEATQVARVMARNGLALDVVEKIMAAQSSREQRLAAADMCIYNDGLSLQALDLMVRQLAARFGL